MNNAHAWQALKEYKNARRGVSSALRPLIERPRIEYGMLDAHMHVMSGLCTPLPLALHQKSVGFLAVLNHFFTRSVVNAITLVFGSTREQEIPFLRISLNTTATIARRTVFFTAKNVMPGANSGMPRLSGMPLCALMMDMEYCHLEGYLGKNVYDYGLERIGLVRWKHRRGERRSIPLVDSSFDVVERFGRQVQSHYRAAVRFPWRILPVFHYEPRRWFDAPGDPFFQTVHGGMAGYRQTKAMLEAAGLACSGKNTGGDQRSGIAVGFKMYPPLGYRPCDFTRIAHLNGYYRVCAELDIPIVAHCHPGGVHTYDEDAFLHYDLRHPVPAAESNALSAGRLRCYFNDAGAAYSIQGEKAENRSVQAARDRRARSRRYFSDEYISPEGWEKVLRRHPGLRLCLAHFGSANKADKKWTNKMYTQGAAPDAFHAPQKRPDLQVRFDADGLSVEQFDEAEGADAAAPRSTAPGIPREPPQAGWEFPYESDPADLYRERCGISDTIVKELMKFPLWSRSIIDLLCTYRHCYTDISYFFLLQKEYRNCRPGKPVSDNPDDCQAEYTRILDTLTEALIARPCLKYKILFGTDFYMARIDVDSIAQYISRTREIVGSIAAALERHNCFELQDPDLWTLWTVINPARFYRLADIRGHYSQVLQSEYDARSDRVEEADAIMQDMLRDCERLDHFDRVWERHHGTRNG